MFLRYVRWSVASFAAVAGICFAPAVSRADTQILVEEINSSGNVIAGTQQIFASSTNITTDKLSNFSSVTITANSNSGAVSSLTTTVNAIPISANFDPSIGIRVIVTSDGFTTPNVGGTATVSNNASASSAISGGQNMLTSNTQLLSDPLGTATSSSSPASGSALGSATGAASDVRPSGGVSPTTTTTINSFPGSFAIQQVVDVQAVNVGSGGVASGSTLGGSASSLVATTAAPVPAPGGLVLALAAVPALGLRRVLRKRSAA